MPAKKITLVATFKDGSFVHRSTTMKLAFAWKAVSNHPKYGNAVETGFSSRHDLAQKAAAAWQSARKTTDGAIEIVPTVEHDAKAWKAELTARQPFRIKYTYKDGRSFHIGNGSSNQDARFETRAGAEASMATYVAASRDGTTYEVVDDTPAAKPAKPARKGRKAAHAPLTAEQKAALTTFIIRDSRNWKRDIRKLWERAVTTTDAEAVVYALRNSHGPAWLKTFILD